MGCNCRESEGSENWNVTAEKVKEVIRNKLNIKEDVVIERAHRIGLKKTNYLITPTKKKLEKNISKPKGTHIYVNGDYSEGTAKLRKELSEQQKIHRLNGKYAKVLKQTTQIQFKILKS